MSHSQGLILDVSWRSATAALTWAVVLGLTMTVTRSAQAQTLNVLHSFTGGGDGASPGAGLTMNRGGNFYGTTEHGGPSGLNGYGTVFKLTHKGSGWVFTSLYSFAGGDDGASPGARVIVGPNGTLYGTTSYGGGNGCGGNGCGTVFNLRPPMSAPINVLSSWTETVLIDSLGVTMELFRSVILSSTSQGTSTAQPQAEAHSERALCMNWCPPMATGRKAFFGPLLEAMTVENPRPAWSSTMQATCTVRRRSAAPTAMARFLSSHLQGPVGHSRPSTAFKTAATE